MLPRILGLALFASLAASFASACGGTSSPDTTPPPTGDGGCVQATQGASCKPSDVACGTGGDVCCTGFFACMSGKWVQEYPGCACMVDFDAGKDAAPADAGPFTCGPSLTCMPGSYCVDQPPGVAFDGGPPPDYFSCDPIPAACAATPTCACVKANGACPTSVVSCDESGGHVTVHCLGA